ncbi:MMPL family transporter [bacterium]|nr:MMPL family transporter [bacterium]MBU1918019.1 MMPL family transporter [bacterium]
MNKVINYLIKLSVQHAKLTIGLALILSALSLFHAYHYLDFDTNLDHLISDKQDYYANYKSFLKEFGDWEYLYVVIKPQDSDSSRIKAKQFARTLAINLNKKSHLFKDITYKIDLSQIKSNLLLLASDKEFADFISFATQNKTALNDFLGVDTIADWYSFLNKLFQTNFDSAQEKQLEKFWPLIQKTIFAPFEIESLNDLKQTNILNLMSDRYSDPDGYLFSENGKLLFVRALPQKDFSQMEIIAKPLLYLRNTLDTLTAQYPHLDVGITGKPVLQNDEATSTQTDSVWAGIISFLLVTFLIFLFYREFKRPILALVALIIAICLTTGFISIVFHSINLITIVFAIILIGLGIDYGIHYLSRYLIERSETTLVKNAIKETSQHTGRAILLGAITSATAFATALFTDFLGLQQLGIIAGIGIIFCCLTALTVFPATLMLLDKKAATNTKPWHILTTLRFVTKKPLLWIILFGLAALVSLPFVYHIGFDNNLLKLQDPNLESVRYEKVIQDNSTFSTWFLAYKTKDLKGLHAIQKEVNKLSTVKTTQSIFDIIPTNQHERIITINKINKLISASHTDNGQRKTVNQQLELLKINFSTLANKALMNGFTEEFEELDAIATKLNKHGIQITQTKLAMPPYATYFMTFIKEKQNKLKEILKPTGLTENKLPESLLSLYKGNSGYYSLTIYPQKDIWIPENMKDFIQDVRQIIPDVTGAPITTYESSKRMVTGFIIVALLTSLLVLGFVFFEFRNIHVPLLIYCNLVLSFILLGSVMYFKDININLANFFALPVLIGTGIDHGIHIMHRFYEKSSIQDLYESTVPAIIMSCLTTICGFGALAFVRHQGLASFGLIMAVGTFIIMLTSIILLPCSLKTLDPANGAGKRR